MAEEEIPQAHLCTGACDCNCNWPACACHFPVGSVETPVFESDEPHLCARCGADAQPEGARAINKDGRTLDFCGDHLAAHRPALERQHWTIIGLRVLAEVSA